MANDTIKLTSCRSLLKGMNISNSLNISKGNSVYYCSNRKYANSHHKMKEEWDYSTYILKTRSINSRARQIVDTDLQLVRSFIQLQLSSLG